MKDVMMKDAMITYLKKLNKGVDSQKVITRLIYNEKGDYVQDLSFFTSLKYMSEELLSAVQSGQTLTSSQELELQPFIIEKSLMFVRQNEQQTVSTTVDFLLDEMCKVLSYRSLFGELSLELNQELSNIKKQLQNYSI